MLTLCYVIRLTHVTVTNRMQSDHLQITFHILGPVTVKDLWNHAEKFTHWEQFQSIASELMSSRIQN